MTDPYNIFRVLNSQIYCCRRDLSWNNFLRSYTIAVVCNYLILFQLLSPFLLYVVAW